MECKRKGRRTGRGTRSYWVEKKGVPPSIKGGVLARFRVCELVRRSQAPVLLQKCGAYWLFGASPIARRAAVGR